MSYRDKENQWCQENNVSIGTMVKILREASQGENGWKNVWNQMMSQYVGREFAVSHISEIGNGLTGDTVPFSFPYHVLSVVSSENHIYNNKNSEEMDRLPNSTSEYVKMQNQWIKENNITTGTKVKVTREAEGGGVNGWTNLWRLGMVIFVGEECTIQNGFDWCLDSDGIKVYNKKVDDWFYFPYFVLEVITEEKLYTQRQLEWMIANDIQDYSEVVITRKGENYEGGWNLRWDNTLNDAIGEVIQVNFHAFSTNIEDQDHDGICVEWNGKRHEVPYTVLMTPAQYKASQEQQIKEQTKETNDAFLTIEANLDSSDRFLVESNNGGLHKQLSVCQNPNEDNGFRIDIISEDSNKQHELFQQLLGKKIRVTIEIIGEAEENIFRVGNVLKGTNGEDFVLVTGIEAKDFNCVWLHSNMQMMVGKTSSFPLDIEEFVKSSYAELAEVKAK